RSAAGGRSRPWSNASPARRRVRTLAAPYSYPREPLVDAGGVAAGPDLRDGAGAAPRRPGDGARAVEPARGILRVPARGGRRSAACVERADGVLVRGPSGPDRRSGP